MDAASRPARPLGGGVEATGQRPQRLPPVLAGRAIRTGAHPALPEPAHQVEPAGAVGRDNEWHSRRLPRDSDHAGPVGAEPVAPERDRAVGLEAQQAVELLDELGEPLVPLPGGERRRSEHGRVESGATRSDAQYHAAVGDVVERRDILGEGNRMPEVRRRHEGAKPDSRRHGRGRRESGDRGTPRLVGEGAPGKVVVGPRVIEPEPFRPRPGVPGDGPRLLGQDDDSEAHVRQPKSGVRSG